MLHFQCDCFYTGDKVQLITIGHYTAQAAFPAEWPYLWSPLPQLLGGTSPSHHCRRKQMVQFQSVSLHFFGCLTQTHQMTRWQLQKQKALTERDFQTPQVTAPLNVFMIVLAPWRRENTTYSVVQLHRPHATTRLSLQVSILSVSRVSTSRHSEWRLQLERIATLRFWEDKAGFGERSEVVRQEKQHACHNALRDSFPKDRDTRITYYTDC